MKKKLKLYVWENFCPDYTSGLAFAIAENEAAARKLVVENYGLEPCQWGTMSVFSMKRPTARCVSGGS